MRDTLAKDILDKLEEKHLVKSMENRMHAKKKLWRFNYRTGISLNENLNAFNKIVEDLFNLGDVVSDEDKALLLLYSLPPQYENFITMHLNNKETVTYKDTTNAMVNYDSLKTETKSYSQSSEALVVSEISRQKSSGSKKSRSQSNGKWKPTKDECSFCRQKGHWKKDCPKL